ncbi:MAG: hypothetical protein V4819_00465 [Verrucomicrobiota bacterium]
MQVLRFDLIDARAQIGIRRATVFLGLGVNAANRPDIRDYHLSDDTTLKMLPDVSESVVDAWKPEFRTWIIAGGFRELIEHLSLFLDGIFGCVVMVPRSTKKDSNAQFEKRGLQGKLKVLADDFGITSGFDDSLSSLAPVRNCLVHRLGVVGKEDMARGKLVLRFHAPRIFVSTPSGDIEVPQVPANSFPIEFPDGGEMKMEPFKLHERRFEVGEAIILSPHELHQILFFSQQCMGRILSSALAYCTSNGAQIEVTGHGTD